MRKTIITGAVLGGLVLSGGVAYGATSASAATSAVSKPVPPTARIGCDAGHRTIGLGLRECKRVLRIGT